MDRQTLASSSSSTSGSSVNPPPPEDAWYSTYLKLLPQWESVSSSSRVMIPIDISRVNQIDAARLDIEMSAMLKEQLVKVFSLMKPGMLFQYEPELDAFLEFLIWRFSIWVDKPTPGNALMNLRYRDERAVEARGKVRTGLEGPGLTISQKVWYCIATVGGQYIWARLQSFSAFRRWGDTEQEMLLLLLPLLNSSSVKNFLRPFSKDKSSNSEGDDALCPICRATPTTPFLALPCQHRYCYYCLRTRCSATMAFRCSRCNEPVVAMQRYGGSINNHSQ
ncbi:UNVERIFIED_CONTAM: Peroxisome biogenesis protein 2 [Sesamum radiatum]|uniref:RING-type E3 ubiquitin transferase (cysteine targeting) n=1 Tax=Sesamum radiatum TaxID=300843 RepID=A0AAW2VJ88_SESRA